MAEAAPAAPVSPYFNVTEADEALHEPGPEPDWNESAFFHLVETDGRSGSLFRIGRRVNEQRAEVTALRLMDDGSALVGFDRPAISGNDAWRAGALDFVREAGEWRVTFDGTLSHLAKGEAFADPGAALRSSPRVDTRFELAATDVAPAYRTSADGTYHGGEAIAKDHYAGVARVHGRVTIDGESREMAGFGFRDHSWGPRNWQAIDCWRWAYGQLDGDNLFSVVVMWHDGQPDVAGIAVRNGRPEVIREARVRTTYGARPTFYADGVKVVIPHPEGEITATFRSTSRLPLRHRKGEEILRIVEQLAEVSIDGTPGVGWFETCDRMSDGTPFGMAQGI
ncbi:MAG: hypothetical protein QM638_00990 [Nocardioides sp.]|uniref:DUF7064 domain-containing protein n=1 Tax=Nocardioides sp. TaxID=35761 RepID=UPI0039E5EFA8